MNENKKTIIGIIILIIAGLVLLKFAPKKETVLYKDTKLIFDTYVSVTVEASPAIAKKAANKAFSKMRSLEKKLNRYDSKSEISKINKNPTKRIVVSNETFRAASLGKKYGKLSNGYFDITIGALIKLFDFNKKIVPTKSKVAAAKKMVNYRFVELDNKKSTVMIAKNGIVIDLGGLAKGFAADEAIKVLAKLKIKSALIDTGSSVSAFNKKSSSKIYRIGIKHPRQDSIFSVLKIKNKHVSTSGDYQQFFEKNGTRYHHIIDPKTGFPAKGFVSVTVVSSLSAAESDIISTAVFAMGPKRGLKFLKTLKNTKAVLIEESGKIISDPSLPGIKSFIELK